MKISKGYVRVGLHILFWIIVTFFMLRFSCLRPTTQSWVKESASVVLLVCCSYFSYFLLVSEFFVRQRFLAFVLSSAVCVLLGGLLEMAIVYDSLTSNALPAIAAANSSGHLWHIYLLSTWLFVSARYAGFVLFFDLIRITHFKEKQIQSQSSLSTNNLNVVFIGKAPNHVSVAWLPSIVCITYENRYVTVTCKDGTTYHEYTSLSKFEEKIVKKLFVRANRNALVALSHVKCYTKSTVILKTDLADIKIPMTDSYNAFETLQELMPDLYSEA